MATEIEIRNRERRVDLALKLVPIVLALIIGAIHAFGLGYLDRLKLPLNPSLSDTIGFFCNGALKTLAAKVDFATLKRCFYGGSLVGIPVAYLVKKLVLKLGWMPDGIGRNLEKVQDTVLKLDEKLAKVSGPIIDTQLSKVKEHVSISKTEIVDIRAKAAAAEASINAAKVYLLVVVLPCALYILSVSRAAVSVLIPVSAFALVFPLITIAINRYVLNELITLLSMLSIATCFVASFGVPYFFGQRTIDYNSPETINLFPAASPDPSDTRSSRWLLWATNETSYWMKCEALQSTIDGVNDGKVVFSRDADPDMDKFFCKRATKE